MNNLFTVKLLQNLRNKKGGKGFTLIELLVVVIIIGVLAAVALPNLLGQVAKGRQSEAKNNLGAVNRAQQAVRLETASFEDLADLPIVVNGNNYDYADTSGFTINNRQASQSATAKTDFQDDILDYSTAVGQTSGGNFAALICESNDVDGATGPYAPTVTNGVPACDATNTTAIQ